MASPLVLPAHTPLPPHLAREVMPDGTILVIPPEPETVEEFDQRMVADMPKGMAAALGVYWPVAAGDWNEDEHPRDDHGRFGDKGGSDQSDVPKGWQVDTSTSAREKDRLRMVAEGVDPAVAEVACMSIAPGAGTTWTSADGKVSMFVHDEANVARSDQAALAKTFAGLNESNPTGHGLSIEVVQTRGDVPQEDSMAAGTYGTTNGAHIEINANVFDPEIQKDIREQGHIGYFGHAAVYTPAPEYIATHEYGHALDFAKGWDGPPNRETSIANVVKSYPPLSEYAAVSRVENYAESYADFMLRTPNPKMSDPPVPYHLSKIDGWKHN